MKIDAFTVHDNQIQFPHKNYDRRIEDLKIQLVIKINLMNKKELLLHQKLHRIFKLNLRMRKYIIY